jgi:hypothetical protein
VMTVCLDVMNDNQGNRLLPKYYLLRAMSIAGKKDRDNFIKSLREIVVKFPNTDEGDEAQRLLDLLEGTSSSPQEATDAEPDGKEPNEDGPKGDYVMKADMDHYFAVLVPNQAAKMSEVRVQMSNFNREYFRNESFKVTNSFLNPDMQMLLVRTFADKEQALGYLTAYRNDSKVLGGFNDQGFEVLVITSKNFATLFKTKDVSGYLDFFRANYQ